MIKQWRGLAVILIGAFALWTPQLMYAQGTLITAQRVPILMYHEVVELGPSSSYMNHHISINPKKFEQQMRFISENNYKTVFMRDLADNIRANQLEPRKTVALTFDDGTQDFYDTALPLLKKYNIRATLYANPGFDGTNERMTHTMIREISESGLVEIAAHTMLHINLTKVEAEEVHEEVFASKAVLEYITGIPVLSFAYPFGEYTDAAIETIMSAGFQSAVIANEQPSKSREKLYVLPRRTIGETDTAATFIRKLEPR